MLEEEGAVIVGLLVGLNVIDANLCVKGEDLDSQVTTALRRQYYIIFRANSNKTEAFLTPKVKTLCLFHSS